MNISRCNLIFYFILGKPTVNAVLDVIWFFYFILGKPTVNVGPDKSVNLGNSVTLQCVVIATPSATSVQWNKITNGVSNRIDVAANPTKYTGASTSTPSLTIYTAANSDQSFYTCQATNAAGTTVSSQTSLTVVGSKYIYYTVSYFRLLLLYGGRCDHHCMVVGYITTCAISVYHHYRCDFKSHPDEVYLTRGFLWVLWFSSPIKLTLRYTCSTQDIMGSVCCCKWTGSIMFRYGLNYIISTIRDHLLSTKELIWYFIIKGGNNGMVKVCSELLLLKEADNVQIKVWYSLLLLIWVNYFQVKGMLMIFHVKERMLWFLFHMKINYWPGKHIAA